MGLYRTIYIGAYIEMPIIKELVKEDIKTCGCKQHYNNNKFCSDCGSEIKIKEVEIESTVHPFEIVSDNNFSCYWIDNNSKCVLFSDANELESNKVFEFNDIVCELIKGEFRRNNKEDIKLLEERSGQTVLVKYGVINDYS